MHKPPRDLAVSYQIKIFYTSTIQRKVEYIFVTTDIAVIAQLYISINEWHMYMDKGRTCQKSFYLKKEIDGKGKKRRVEIRVFRVHKKIQ